MKTTSKVILLLSGLFLPAFSVQAQEAKLFPARVSFEHAVVRENPDVSSAEVFQLKAGSLVGIISQRGDWYRIQLTKSDGTLSSAWIEKASVQLVTSTPTASPTPNPSPTQTKEEVQSQEALIQKGGVRVFATPVLNVYRFGTNQYRVGAAFEKPFSDIHSLGLSLTYATGNGNFSSFQGGLNALFYFQPWDAKDWAIFQRTGLFFERFWGNSKSFYALTADVAAGFQYQMTEHFSFLLEPFSLEVTPIKSVSVPWFLRAQTQLSVRGTW